MREQFSESIQEYNELLHAQEHAKRPFDQQAIQEELQRVEVYYASHEDVAPEDERAVLLLQQQKQEVMRHMHEQFKKLDGGEVLETERGTWNVRQQGEGQFIALGGGRQIEISLGQLLTDAEWGMAYDLNDQTIERGVKKRFLVERAKQKLQDLLDKQIISVESQRGTTHLNLHRAYKHVAEDRESTQMQMGIIAERMVRTYLQQLAWDYPELGFTVERADVQQDVENKIDFIIHRRSHTRGVNIEAVDGPKDAGIQFTTRHDVQGLKHKQEQLARAKKFVHEVDDLVLVSLPMEKFAGAYTAWRSKQTPGGPERFWDQSTKDEIFRNIMVGFLSPEEVEREMTLLHQRPAA